MKRRLYIQLGRAGDILNVLPLLWRDFRKTGERQGLLVAEAHISLLDGVSYVEPFGFDGDFREIHKAWAYAASLVVDSDREIVCTQIYGEQLKTMQDCWSFMRESWNRVPDAPSWGTLQLVFDRRDPAREQAVIDQLTKRFEHPEWPFIVLALEGTSSPFPDGAALKRELQRYALSNRVNVVDISGFTAHKFYDLLGLFERASCLVAIDSGPLHLAHAVPTLPVVALITREPDMWHGSPWRPQHVRRYFYDAFPEAIETVAADVCEIVWKNFKPTAQIAHVWSDWRKEGKLPYNDRRRIKLAQTTWQTERDATGLWIDCEFKREHATRDARDIGDPVEIAYVRDLIEHAASSNPSGIIALTNADVCFTPGITGKILDAVTDETAAFTHRFDFKWLRKPILYESQVRLGKWIPGSDAFFFTVNWWNKHRDEYADFVLGRGHWDEVFRQLIKRHGGRCIPAAIYHETHDSFWLQDRYTIKGNLHNAKLAKKWFLRSGYAELDPYWWKLPETDGPNE